MSKIIPVVTLKTVEERTAVLSALRKSGILCAEICFRTECAEEAILQSMWNADPDTVLSGTKVPSLREFLKENSL